ncbi:hypothetical protein C0966_15215 [Bacillus methanolicus]|uniref:hypothetical protein n=1 Tax=Bacillus methanolicus TaxID=1471 RepID=UPI00237FF8F1|nr:hypothetical protein [Bacillus methanolicus]MDE3840652.1 hypothetical protein [Bacillus methanolicus]
MNIFNINLFQFKTKPEGKERASEFLNEGYIAIGWSKVPDMTSMSKEDIREALASAYGYSGRSLSTNLGTVNTFRNVMRKGDVVLITQDGFVHIGIIGDYEYHPDKIKDGTCHRRSCVWKKMVKKDELREEVKSLLRNMTTVTKYPHPFITSGIGEILGLVTTQKIPQSEHIHPLDIWEGEDKQPTPNEKEHEKLLSRLESLGTTALEILEEEMQSEDPDRRRKAAVEILSILKHSPKQPLDGE